MVELLPDRVPWFLGGPALGLLVVALYGIANQRLGVSGSYVHVATLLRRGPKVEMWRVWFFVGLAAGAALVAAMRGGASVGLGYGALGLLLPLAALVPLLFVAGVVMGYGARWGGGCTSGHGISGVASLSPASIVAAASFMATAVAVTLILHVVTGGAL